MITRTKSATKVEEVEENITDDVQISLPHNDEAFTRKFVLMKDSLIANPTKIVRLPHPKQGFALFRIGIDFEEVLSVNDGFRSWFYGDTIVEDGSLFICAPYNPLFVIIPYLMKNKGQFIELYDILQDEECEGLKELIDNELVLKSLEYVTDFKDVCDSRVYRLNENKLKEWIEKRFNILKNSLKDDVHKSLYEDSEAYDRYVFSVLSDFLNEECAIKAKKDLNVKDAPLCERIDMGIKRKNEDDLEYEMVVKKVVKKPREALVAKKLQTASKGTKSITNFFVKKC